jgi:hypothetical protein
VLYNARLDEYEYCAEVGFDGLALNERHNTLYSTTGAVEGSLRDARDPDYGCGVVQDCCTAWHG